MNSVALSRWWAASGAMIAFALLALITYLAVTAGPPATKVPAPATPASTALPAASGTRVAEWVPAAGTTVPKVAPGYVPEAELEAGAQPGPAAASKVWIYNGGFFAERGGGVWSERNNRNFTFKEVARNDEFIELYDQSRDCAVRLYPDRMLLKGLGQFPTFTKYYDGQWLP